MDLQAILPITEDDEETGNKKDRKLVAIEN